MGRRTLDERIEELTQKEQQLAARKETLQARQKSVVRKQRTRTLIQVGGVMAILGVTTPEDAQQLQRYVQAHESWWEQWQSITSVSK